MISGGTVARAGALVLTVVLAAICLLIALAIAIMGLGAGQYYEALGAGLLLALVGGLPPSLTAVVLYLNARLLMRGVAGRWAKRMALAAALLMGVCAFMTLMSHVSVVFALLFFMVAALLAAPLALPSPTADGSNS